MWELVIAVFIAALPSMQSSVEALRKAAEQGNVEAEQLREAGSRHSWFASHSLLP